jgi:hypothetical protein
MSEPPVTIKHMDEKYALSTSDDQVNGGPADQGSHDLDAPLMPLERLEQRICELAAHLAAGTCRFLQLVAEFDAREGWASWDLPSCAAWLAWKCQVAPGTAREQVRVARALERLPLITAQFAAGRMSYAKVRALTRIGTPATEKDLAEITGPMTAAQCERFIAAHRKASDAQDLANRETRRVRVRVGEDGLVTITAKLPAADGAVVLQALRAAAGDCEHPHRPHHDPAEDTGPCSGGVPAETRGSDPAPSGPGRPGTGTCRASLADALVQVAGAYLSGKITTAGNPDIYQVIVHVGPEALTSGPDASAATSPGRRPEGHPAHPQRCHLDDGPAISPAAAQALACHATVSWMLHDHHGNVLDVGRRHRRPTPALRRAVRERDRCRCQFPGCNSRRTDIHHITPWAKGGTTRLPGLISLCEAHHVIVHALGYLITPAPDGFAFTRPDGQPIRNAPALPADKLDLDLAIWAAFANARTAADEASQQQELVA